MPITPGGRFSPGDADDWDLTTDLAAMQVSNEAATDAAIGTLSTQVRSAGIGVANAAARNALFPSPTQGDTVFRRDLGITETYRSAYSASNVGGASPAGWYPERRIFTANRGGTQSLTGAQWNILTSCFVQVRNDGLGTFSNGVLTVAAGGTYRVSASAYFATATNPNSIQITRNSATADTSGTIAAGIVDANSRGGYTVSNVCQLSAGDAIRVLVFTNTANSISTTLGIGSATFNVERID
ncbi:hypothetical protein SEA_ROMAN_56 [Microbacterium phage Roman]|nr:hypothetical protein SEA_ROMAN_56 [Microbacterium phage Roman]